MRRIESVDAFAVVQPEDWPTIAVDACRLAISASGIDDEPLLDALRAVEGRQVDLDAAASMRRRADQLDEEAWSARDSKEDDRHDRLFRQSRTAAALGFALSGEPDEALYEAAYAVGTPEDLIRQLRSSRQDP